MVLLGIWGIWSGGDIFHVFVAIICGLMCWELTRMVSPTNLKRSWNLGIFTGVSILIAIEVPFLLGFLILLVPAAMGGFVLDQNRALFVTFSVMICLSGFSMIFVRDGLGLSWMVWLISLVVATDVAGYFAGRLIGGPKFWPTVSPKKTWAGTSAGWIAGGLVGAVFAYNSGAMLLIVSISFVLSFASQMGDIAESAVKRKMGVKDSSMLIPGHGGVFDRFDGFMGAALMMLPLKYLGFPPGVS